ncbi:hypothetical protein LSPCS325_51970 [Lysinibacillus sp. CTST325]
MGDRLKKLEERIGKRKERIEKLHSSLKEEKNRLKKDEETLKHLKYDEVLKRMHETGFSPDKALRAIDNELEKSQSNGNQGGVQNNGNDF